MSAAARTRIGRVKLKAGGADLHLLPTKGSLNERATMNAVRHLVASMDGDIAGWAFVVWGNDMSSAAQARSYSDALARLMIPTFAKERLLAKIIEDWTMMNFEPPA